MSLQTVSAIRGDGTLAELASRYKIHPNMITKWKREALEGMKDRFARSGKSTQGDHQTELKELRAKIGELVVERDFLQRAFDR